MEQNKQTPVEWLLMQLAYKDNGVWVSGVVRDVSINEVANMALQMERELMQQQAELSTPKWNDNLPWDKYPFAKWAAMDNDGEVYVFEHEPTLEKTLWHDHVNPKRCLYVNTFHGDISNWWVCIMERPEGV